MAKYIKTEEGYKEIIEIVPDISIKMDANNPVGTGSFSMNRKADTGIGLNSHTEGSNTTASGNYSHAEGSETVASGYISHAEGDWTTASGFYSHVEGDRTTAIGNSSHAEGSSTNMFSSVVTTTNPTIERIIGAWETKKFSVASGDYSHVEGKDNLALNNYSHAEGYKTTAKGIYSHAEGYQAAASGSDSHAEGGSTKASGNDSHAEGYQSTASGSCSHAEGNYTAASGNFSHAEGNNTKASKTNSHAEGLSTTASGSSSHAEGSGTIASGECSHVQGKYNIEDFSHTYADIIGNGVSTKHSNAATVDWNGNAWFAGDIYTGSTSGTNKDDGSKKLATEEYVNNSIAASGTDISLGITSAAIGQIIKIKAVDESGKPTAWEAVNIPSAVTDEHINSLIDAKLRTFQAP